MKRIGTVTRSLFLVLIFMAGFLPLAAEDSKPKIAVIRIENDFDNSSYETVCDTVTETVEFTLKLMGRYRIERTDYIDPYDNFDKAKEFFRNYNFDNAIFGRVFPDPDGDIVLAMKVYDRGSDEITIEKEVEVESLMEVFDGSDQLTAAIVEAFSGEHIGFGTLVFSGGGDVGDVVVYINGEEAGMNPSRMTILQGERTIEIRQVLPEGEKLLKRTTVEVVENTETEVTYTVIEEAEEEELEEEVLVEKEIEEEKPSEEDNQFAMAYFDEENYIRSGKKLFFPNIFHDYEDFFLYLEGLPQISEDLRTSMDTYQKKIRKNKAGLITGLGILGASIVPLYIGIYAYALGSVGDLEIGETAGLILMIAGGSGAVIGLTTAGITAAVVFRAKPGEVVEIYNKDYGF